MEMETKRRGQMRGNKEREETREKERGMKNLMSPGPHPPVPPIDELPFSFAFAFAFASVFAF